MLVDEAVDQQDPRLDQLLQGNALADGERHVVRKVAGAMLRARGAMVGGMGIRKGVAPDHGDSASDGNRGTRLSSASADGGSPGTVADRRRRPAQDGDVEPDASERVRFAADYQDHHEAVVAEAMRICGPDHADEVADTIFLTLLREPRRVATLGGDRRLSLLTLASLLAGEVVQREHARRASGQRAVPRGANACDEAGKEWLGRSIEVRVAAALDGLPPGERDAIAVAFFGQLSYRATAARLGQPEEAVKSRVRTGLRRLREVTIESPVRPPSHFAEGTSEG